MATREQDIPQSDKLARIMERAKVMNEGLVEPAGPDPASRIMERASTLIGDLPEPTAVPVSPALQPAPLLKEGVDWTDMQPFIGEAWADVERVAMEVTGERPFVTSGREGVHMEGSIHPEGGAFDLRTRDLDPETIVAYRQGLADSLGPDWDVLIEGGDQPHIHSERNRGAAEGPVQDKFSRIMARAAELEPEPPPVPEEKPGILSRIFHKEEERLGLGAEAARGLARTPGQFVEGAGGMLEAAASVAERPVRSGRMAFLAPEAIGGPDPTIEPMELGPQALVTKAVRRVGQEFVQAGRESQEFFPASTAIDRANLRDLNSLVAGGAEAIGQLGTQILLAAGTGGSSAVVRFLMFASPTVALEGGNAFLETRTRLVESGMDVEEAERVASGSAALTGLGALAIERIPAARFVFNKIPGAEQLFGQRMAQLLAGRAGRVASMVSGAAAEGVEEAMQEVWASVVQDIQADNPEAYADLDKRLLAAGVFGGIGGTFGGLVTHVGPGAPAEAAPGPPVAPGEPPAPTAPPLAPEAAEAPPGAPGTLPVPSPDVTKDVSQDVSQLAAKERIIPETKEEKKTLRRRVAEAVDPSVAQELQEAFTDPKTGLSNPQAWETARPRIEADPEQEVVMVDLRNFKAINDLHSREEGDRKLKEVATKLLELEEVGIRARDIFRAGGDEFTIAVQTGTGERVGQRVVEAIGEEAILNKAGEDTGFVFAARYGVGQTMDQADQATTEAKKVEEGERFRKVEKAPPVEEAPPAYKPHLEEAVAAEEAAPAKEAPPPTRKPLVAKTGEVLHIRQAEDGFYLNDDPSTPITPEMELRVVEIEEGAPDAPNLITVEAPSGEEFEFYDTDLRREGEADLEARGQETLFAPPPTAVFAPGEEPVSRETVDPARTREQEVAKEAEDEARILLGNIVASEEEVAEIEEEGVTDEEALEADALEEPGREQAEALEGAIRPGEIDSPPPGGRPGGPRHVREDRPGPDQEESDLDTASDRDVRRGSGTPGSRVSEERGDRVGRQGGVPGLDFRIESGQQVFDRGDITKTKNNIAAIKVLRDVEAQGRQANAAEQAKLVKYVGWGGLANALEPGEKKRWKELNAELLEILTEEELAAAKRSVPNAHYTSIPIIRAMHDAMEHLGIPEDALVLEPSMGNGHFLGAGPAAYRWFGVELDSLTGRIAKLLYPKQEINVRGFETVPLPDDHFDAAMSNVPFGDFKVDDPAYRSLKFNIHNYFFAKALDKVRPGGVVAFITSAFSMDAKDTGVRKYLAERADLLGAVRLPNNAFKANAATEVTTDILFLRKRQPGQESTYEGAVPADAWTQLDKYNSPDGPMWINKYFVAHPEMMLGTMGLQGTMRARAQPALIAPEGQNLGQELRTALARLPSDVVPQREGPVATAIDLPEVVDATTQEGSMRVLDTGEIYQIQRGALVDAKVPRTQWQNVKALIRLRDQTRTVLQLQRDDASDAEIEGAQKTLAKLHNDYLRARGPINREKLTKLNRVQRPNLTPFRRDPDASLVSALEIYDPENDTAEKAPIFTQRVIQIRRDITDVANPTDALPVSLAEKGKVDLPYMAELAGSTEEDIIEALRGQIYLDPSSQLWVTEDEYLSGNVKQKLILAKAAAKRDEKFEEQVQALEAIQPEDLKPSQISASLGAPWIGPPVYEDFINGLLERQDFNRVRIGHVASQGLFTIEAGKTGWGPLEDVQWGTKRVPAGRLFELALNQKQPTVYDKIGGDNVKNVEETLNARAKLADMKEKFEGWVWSSEHAEGLVREYNDEYNTDRERVFDGSHLRPAGISPTVDLHAHQLNAAWRVISTGNTLLAHVVGGGKTWTMIVAAMEQRRMGLVKKPMMVVPNHMLEQFSREFIQLYPSARILTATEADFSREKRQLLLGRMATGDWDAVIVTHSGFKKIAVTIETRKAFLTAEIAKLEDAIREQKAEQGHNKNILKKVEKAKLNLEAKLNALGKAEEKDPGLRFEETGVDQIYVDEAHYFKNLFAPTKIEGISMAQSQRATDLFMKTRHLEAINPGRGIIFSTATPISNSMTEVYTMMRYLQLPLLEERGLAHFDSWAGTFGEHVTTAELAPDGSGYRMASRFARFRNLPELSQMFRRVWDVQRADDLKLDVPRVKGGTAEVIASEKSPQLDTYVQELVRRSEKLATTDPREDNMLKITGDGRRAALDMRLVDPTAPAIRGRKADLAAERIFDIWEDSKENRSAQMIFIDISTPNAARFNVYQDLKEILMEQGIPEGEIAFIHDHATDIRKAQLFKDVREGKIRILFGSTDKMGVGTNAQKRLLAIHHLDAPWRPSDIEQRDGRMVRQGNTNPEVQILRYVTEGSFDAYMWQGLERKQFFIEQIMTGDPTLRSAEDIGGSALNASETKALASGNPAAIEKASVDSDLAGLRRLKQQHLDGQLDVVRSLATLPEQITALEENLRKGQEDERARVPTQGDAFRMRVGNSEYSKRPEAGEKLIEKFSAMVVDPERKYVFSKVGSIAGFEVWARAGKGFQEGWIDLQLRGLNQYALGTMKSWASPMGPIRKLENAAEHISSILSEQQSLLEDRRRRLKQAQDMKGQPFAREEQMAKLEARQGELEVELRLDKGHQEDQQVWQEDEGDEDPPSGPEDLTDDELRERDDAGFLDFRPLFERRPQRDPLITSDFPEVEARFQKAKGIEDLPLFEKAKDGFEAFTLSMRRTHPEIDPDESTTMALNQDILRQFSSARDFSMAMSYHEIRQVTEDLDDTELDLLTRLLVLPDIEKDYEEGLYEGKEEMPFGYANIEELKADLRKFEAAVATNSKVADALERRRQMTGRLTKLLVKADLLHPKVLQDSRYYHRQVMKYFQAKDFTFAGVGGRDVRLKKKGFQFQRIGGGDFNTAYQESEIEWMAQGWELLSRIETLQRLQEINDIKGTLKKEARAHNESALAAKFAVEEMGLADPLLPFRTKIAFSNIGLAKLAAEGELSSEGGRYGELIEDLGGAYSDWKTEMAERDKADREPFRFEHGEWFPFLSHLLETGRPGAMQAGTIFKAIRGRETFMKEELGNAYIDPTNVKELVRKLAPEGYTDWQPKKGTNFFLGLTVEERVLERAREEGRPLDREEVRQMLIVGGPRETWIIRSNLAQSLDNVKPLPYRGDDAMESLWVQAQTTWKQWILLNPVRFLKYNFNNMSGDADIAFAYDPKIITKYAVRAAKDLARHTRGTASEEVSQEILNAIEMGVVGSGLRVAEIPDINETGAFRFLTQGRLNPGQKIVNRYWGTVRGFTDWRENILRLAADRYFRDRIEAGDKNLYAASRRSDIDALETEEAEARKLGDLGKAQELNRRRSSKLARELIGDYGNISKGGIWLRRHMIPFYSWIEINAPRYYRLLKNMPHEGQERGRGRAVSAVAVKKGSMLLLRMNVLFMFINMFNHFVFPDEEEELGSNRRNLHLILGRRPDGTIISIRMEGALSDALEWFGLEDYPADIRDLFTGEKTVQDQGAEFVKAPIERIVNSWEPFTKTGFEYFMGRSTYPTVFEEGASFKPSTRPVRDRTEHVLRTVSLNRLYSRVTGKPQRPTQGPLIDFLSTVLLYTTDPGEAAYWQAKEFANNWQEAHGKERGDFTPTKRSTALYYWKKAIQWGDEDAAVRWEIKYRDLGGTDQGMRQSIRMGGPLGSIAQREHAAYLSSLTPKERQLVDLAIEWYGKSIGAAAPPRPAPNRPRPPKPPTPR